VHEEEKEGKLRLRLALLSGVFLGLGLLAPFTGVPMDVGQVLSAGSPAFAAAPVLYDADARIRVYPFNEDLLMAVAGLGAGIAPEQWTKV